MYSGVHLSGGAIKPFPQNIKSIIDGYPCDAISSKVWVMLWYKCSIRNVEIPFAVISRKPEEPSCLILSVSSSKRFKWIF